MKLYYSPHSPYVRKVLVSAVELDLFRSIELLPSTVGPIERDKIVVAQNPLGQVPTLVTGCDSVLTDSRVICEYLNEVGNGSILPASGPDRFAVLTDHTIADGLVNAALLARYEDVLRPAEKRWEPWYEAQMNKIRSVLDYFTEKGGGQDGRVDVGTITLACGLGYLDHRFPDFDWRAGRSSLAAWHHRFSERPSMQATRFGVDLLIE